MGNSGMADGLFSAFLNWLYSSGDITVPSDFHTRCEKVQDMLDNDISGVINSLLNYSIQSASEALYRIECNEPTLQKLLNTWLQQINLEVKGIPTGLQALSKEYFKERWAGSSLCVLRATSWKKISVDNVTIEVPTVLWFANGASIYVKRPKNSNYKLGTDEYYLDESRKFLIPTTTSEYISIQKPYNRWFDEYATPYLIRSGVYKNWLGMKVLQEKSDEVISKILPYLFIMQKGTENLFLKDMTYSDTELKEMVDNFKQEAEKYRNQKGKLPAHGIPFDQKYEHLIPDLRNILTEELYRQGFRSILAGLGFVDMLEIAPSRQESRLNPKPFVSEVNSGVEGFKSMLLDIVLEIIARNKETHRKFFSNNNKLIVVSSPLKINVEQILADIRSGYDRGALSIESYTQTLGFDFETEKERRTKELDEGLEDLMYPHLIQNREGISDRVMPAKPKNEKNENLNKKKDTPEADNFKNASIDETENFYRVRQIEPEEFDKESFRTIWISKSEGIKAIIGKKKDETTTTIQSILFEKDKWTEDKIRIWIKNHSDRFHAYLEVINSNTEDLEIAPYKTNEDLPKYLNKYPEGAKEVFRKTFNEVYERTGGDESKAFPIAWNSLKRWMKKNRGEK